MALPNGKDHAGQGRGHESEAYYKYQWPGDLSKYYGESEKALRSI